MIGLLAVTAGDVFWWTLAFMGALLAGFAGLVAIILLSLWLWNRF